MCVYIYFFTRFTGKCIFCQIVFEQMHLILPPFLPSTFTTTYGIILLSTHYYEDAVFPLGLQSHTVPYNRKGRVVVVVVAAIAHTTDNPCNTDYHFPRQSMLSMERVWWIRYKCAFPACMNVSCLTDRPLLSTNRWWLYFVLFNRIDIRDISLDWSTHHFYSKYFHRLFGTLVYQ